MHPTNTQPTLFSASTLEPQQKTFEPMAHSQRPKTLQEFLGFEELKAAYPLLQLAHLKSLVLYGPPGTGKTTLAKLLAQSYDLDFFQFNAVLGGVQDLKKLMLDMRQNSSHKNRGQVLFIDEIHRFNKSQQDALLPHIESGEFIFIGSTTENPRTHLNPAILSRIELVKLSPLKEHDQLRLIEKILLENLSQKDLHPSLEKDRSLKKLLINYSHGDCRTLINYLESIVGLIKSNHQLDEILLEKIFKEKARHFDRDGDRHYDVISAFIKSLRGSDPDAAILWLSVMLEGGEDPTFIARRLMIFASEDVGNADPTALTLATNGLIAVEKIGMPEARILLAQVTTYLASTFKSNSSYLAINQGMSYVKNHQTIEVPLHLKNFPPKFHSVQYQYPHNFPQHFIAQEYSPQGTPQFYVPTQEGREEGIHQRLKKLYPEKNYPEKSR